MTILKKFNLRQLLITCLWLSQIAHAASPTTPLADKPLFTSYAVPGNVALVLSVEFPTAINLAYPTNLISSDPTYSPNYFPPQKTIIPEYLGYFDPNKCYDYYKGINEDDQYFKPIGIAVNRTCSGHWSGNFLNWTLTQTIDPMRQILTGGYRVFDSEDLTVLEKAWHSGEQGASKSISNATLVSGATPFTTNSISIDLQSKGNQFVYSIDGGKTKISLYARVQVCASESLKESNCTTYPNGKLKPTGLIQKNASKLNFAAIGYGIHQTTARDGGVLRAKMGFVGPTVAVPGMSDSINPNPEWDSNTGIFYNNPDTASSSASGVTNSGVINYLNKFGKTKGKYKQFDPASELYYSALRYFKNQGNVPEYTDMSSLSQANKDLFKDGFPIITDWNDPIKYSCQANFIIGVGDVNTHRDGNLPGSSRRDANATPTLVNQDGTVNVTTATNMVGNLEGIANLGSTNPPWSFGGTYYIAGLAYDAHTKDIRPPNKDGKDPLPGKQTIKTYWLDVLEGGNFRPKNQYWLAAKYGGFDVPENFDPYSTSNTALTDAQWQPNALRDPSNYFRINNPKVMQENLSKAFDDILRNLEKSSNSLAVTSRFFTGNEIGYSPSYKVDGWSGDVIAQKVTLDPNNGQISLLTNIWSASEKLESRDPDTRIIATGKLVTNATGGEGITGVPFRIVSLGSNEKTALEGILKADETLNSAGDVLNYLRGKKTITNNRKKILGDITVPELLTIAGPYAPYGEARNPGYTAFKNAYKNRAGVVYAPANDGMLHAFATGVDGGQELFAYVPQALFQGPNNTPKEDGLAALAKPSYIHHAYVNKTPVVQDVNFGGGSDDWHSILVGGLGKGGKAYYAIDVTDPSKLTNEELLASKVLWEFKHPNMGYSFGVPRMAKTKQHGWVVILTSGYNNEDRKGHFFIVNPKNGSLIQDIPTPGSTNSDGMANVSTFINDYADYTADAAYAGDLQGNIWRLDLTKTTGNYDPPTLIAKLTNKSGQAQPITTPPVPAIDFNTGKRFVFIGSGRLLDETDVISMQEQSFYTIIDGTWRNFYTSTTLPVAFPFTRENMVDNSTVQGASLSNNQVGWFIDLGFGGNSNAYRINVPMKVENGYVLFSANLPDNSDVCNPSGSAVRFAFDYSTGISALPNRVANQKVEGLVESNSMYNSARANGTWASTNTGAGGSLKAPDVKLNSTQAPFKVLNWREINTE